LDVKSFVRYADVNAIYNIIRRIKNIHVNLIKFKDLEEIWINNQIKFALSAAKILLIKIKFIGKAQN
jgi:hypothetical protein